MQETQALFARLGSKNRLSLVQLNCRVILPIDPADA
jgi:hypothetical protein